MKAKFPSNVALLLKWLVPVFLIFAVTQSAYAYNLGKKQFLSRVKQRMQLTRTAGLSGRYYSIGNISEFIATVDRYLLGVYIDHDYLKKLASTNAFEYYLPSFFNLSADQGYTQGRGRDSGKHPAEEDRYDGSVIFAGINALEEPTAFHEAIHVFAFARQLGDLDRDDFRGPEFISGQLVDLLVRLQSLDRELEGLVSMARSGRDIQAGGIRFVKRLDLVQKLFNEGFTPQGMQLFRAMGGKADFKGYRLAVGALLDNAVAEGRSGGGGPRDPNKPNWTNGCYLKNNSGGATLEYTVVDPPPYSGVNPICSDRDGVHWFLGGRVTNIAAGPRTSSGCFSGSTVTTSKKVYRNATVCRAP